MDGKDIQSRRHATSDNADNEEKPEQARHVAQQLPCALERRFRGHDRVLTSPDHPPMNFTD